NPSGCAAKAPAFERARGLSSARRSGVLASFWRSLQAVASEPTAADLRYMRLAIELATEAGQRGDVPVGALVVRDGRILGVGFNTRELDHDPTGHAEVVATREACRAARRWRLDGASLYVTLEPCPMCAGTLVNAR